MDKRVLVQHQQTDATPRRHASTASEGEASEDRESANKESQQTVAHQQAMQTIVAKVFDRLKQFYVLKGKITKLLFSDTQEAARKENNAEHSADAANMREGIVSAASEMRW